MKLPYGCRVSGAAECLRCQFAVRARTGQFAGVAALRSALHSYRTFTTRGRYFISRRSFDSDVLQLYPMCNYNFRFIAVFRFCLAAERLMRGGTRQGDALFPRASPLQKQSTGLFLNSPLAEGLLTLEVSRSAERDRGAAPGPRRL